MEDKFKPISERWNRVLERISAGKEMTDNNKEAIQEMIDYGFDFEQIKKEALVEAV